MSARRTWDGGWWEHATGTPHPALSALVRGPYVGWAEGFRRPVVRRETGSTVIPLILNLGAPYRLRDDGASVARSHHSFIAGVTDHAVLVEGPPVALAMQCDLTLPGAFRLLGVPPGAYAGETLALDALLGATAAALIERLGAAPDWPARFHLLDAFLLDRLARSAPIAPRLELAWHLLHARDGRIAPGRLAELTGWSHKQLIHRCRHDFGATPGTLGRLLRFERATRLARGGAGWSRIAADAGYADQSHLHRDFVRFAGLTPATWRAATVPGAGVLHDDPPPG